MLAEKLPKQRRRLFALLVHSLLLLKFRPRASFAGDSVRVALPATDSLQPAADALPDDGRRSTLWAARVTRLVIHRCGPRDAEGERRILALRNAS